MKMAAHEQKLCAYSAVWPKLLQIKPAFLICLTLLTASVYGQHFTTIKSDEGIEILENHKKVLFYQVRPKSVGGKYERAGFVHPLYSFNEKSLTEDMPEDHPYHRGIFWAWHQIIWHNKQIADGWISQNISWEPSKIAVQKKKKSIILQSEMLWKSVLDDNRSKPVVREHTLITVYRSTSQSRIIDFDIQLFALEDSLKIGGSDDEKGYGGFCLRLKLPGDISFVSNDIEVTPLETAVHAGPWMNFTGSFDGEDSRKIGIAVFCHDSNPGHLTEWILRKKGSMQNVAYPGRKPVALSKNGLRLRYRLVIHDTNIGKSDLENLYQEYIRKH
jgi:methane monooxygenase PmoA-like